MSSMGTPASERSDTKECLSSRGTPCSGVDALDPLQGDAEGASDVARVERPSELRGEDESGLDPSLTGDLSLALLPNALELERPHASLGSATVRRGFLVFVSPRLRTDRHSIMCGGTPPDLGA